MMHQRIFQSKPPMPVNLLEMSPDEYFDLLRERGYSEHAATKEVEKLEQFHKRYLPPKKKTVNDVPVRDTNDKAYKALERVLQKKQEVIDEQSNST